MLALDSFPVFLMTAHTIPVLTKAIAVLRAIAEENEGMTTKVLAHMLGISSSTTYRIMQTLLAEDWVRVTSAGHYELSWGLRSLLRPPSQYERLIETARPFLAQLARETGLVSKLSVQQGEQAVALARAESPQGTAVSVRLGATFSLSLGSSGSVLLSELPIAERRRLLALAPQECWERQTPADVEKRIADCRRSGVCSDFGTYRSSIYALSSPVRSREGGIVGAFTVILRDSIRRLIPASSLP
jgi:DNA-binding IclR family transcriptional regulator